MTFDVVVTEIRNPRAKQVLARYLAHDPSVSLQKALVMLETPPVIYARSVPEPDARMHLLRLQKIGVQGHIMESAPCEDAPAPAIPYHTSSPRTHPPVLHPVSPGSISARPSLSAVLTDTTRKNPSHGKYALAAIIALIIIAGLLSLSTRRRYTMRRTQGTAFSPPERAREVVPPPPAASHAADPGSNVPTPSPERERSQSFADSARKLGATVDAIRFYKLAISFNAHNLDAWMGLVGAYRERKMADEAEKTRTRMQEIFGGNVFSLQEVVGRFGPPLELTRSEDGTLRIEYATGARNRKDLVTETFALVRALDQSCACSAVSIYARAPGTKGLLVFLALSPFPRSLAEYEANATLTFL